MRDLAVLHQIALHHGEVEFTRGGVYGAAAHAAGIQTVAHGGDHLGLVILAHRNVRVAHTAGGRVGIALAAAAAGRSHVHAATAQFVDHVMLEDTVFDQHQLRGGIALVVHMQGAPLVLDGAVVQRRHAGSGDLLTQLAGKFADAIGYAGGF